MSLWKGTPAKFHTIKGLSSKFFYFKMYIYASPYKPLQSLLYR